MTYEEKERIRFINKLVSNARAIISNQVGLPMGVRKMNALISWLEPYKNKIDIDLSVFRQYDLQTDDLPTGTERLEWNIEKLIEFEKDFDEVNQMYRADLFRKCRKIIDYYVPVLKELEGKEE